MQFIIYYGETLDYALSQVRVRAEDFAEFRDIATTELNHVEQHNCAQYNLARAVTQRWIDAGRPG